MLKSKIFIKAILITLSTILILSLALIIFTVPKIEEKITSYEEKNAREKLSSIVIKINTVHNNLESFKKIALEQHKSNLVNLTDTVWSIIQSKYNQSKIENIGQVLKKRALEFEKNLMNYYNNNKDKMSEEELKKSIIKYIEIYKYNEGDGYFWASEYESSKMVIHPILPNLNGKSMDKVVDSDGVNIEKESRKAVDRGDGILKYRWFNPLSKKVEKKISYVFKFEPFNWVIGTGEYFNILKKRLQGEVFELIKQIKYDKNNYFFVLDYNNRIVSHPYLENKVYSDKKDIKGNLLVPPMIKIAREKGSGFYTYWWKKNVKDDTAYKKISYVRDFPEWEIVIGTGIYDDVIEKEVEKRKDELFSQLSDTIKKTRFSKTGYLYIMTKKGIMLIHPNSNIDGKNIKKAKNPVNNKFMYEELIKGYESKEKKFYYTWDKPSDKGNYIYEKVSWLEYIPEFEWYVASSVYTDELKESAIELRNYIIAITIFVILLTLILNFIFFKNLLTPLNKLINLVSKISIGNYSVRYPHENKNDEISTLGKKFNEMLETIEHRSMELQESNDELEHIISNLKKTQNKLVESEKLAGLGKLVAGVAHEINTPIGLGLTASSHFSYLSETLKEKYESDEMTQEEFESYLKDANDLSTIIYSNLDRASDIVKNFKAVAIDQTTEQKRLFNLKEYTKGVLFSIDNITKKKDITIDINCKDDLMVDSYPGLYSQIITNLIINSVKHGFKSKDKGLISISIELNENLITLEYKDDGKGIAKENLSKIYDPFFTTNREEGGAGLGLNIIYNIVTINLKGTITCESEKDKGVIFIIKFPIE